MNLKNMNSDIKKRIEHINSGQVPEGYKKEHGYSVPKDWDVKKLNELFKKVTTKNKDDKTLPVLTNSAINGVVLQDSYFDREIVTEGNTDTYYIVEQNDFMYNPRISANAPAGPINKNRLDTAGITSPLYTIFRGNEGVFLDFYESYFKSPFWHNYMKSVANQGARHDRLNLLDKDFFNMPLPYPKEAEQQNIAEILAACDRVIELKEDLLTGKQRQKKWLMQRLLAGDIRLKGFSGDWKEVKLGEIFDYVPTYSFSRSQLNYETNNTMCIHYGDIHSNFPVIVDVEKENNNSNIPKLNDDIEIKNEYLLKDGDLIIADVSEDYEGVGQSILITNLQNHQAVSGLHTFVLRDNKGMTDKIYRGYFLYENNIKNKIRKIATGASVLGISKTNLEKIKVFIPPMTEEQEAIAEILSTADKELDLLQKEIDEYKQLKKSLMQLLLTGVVRVNELKINTRPLEKQEAQAC